MATTPGRSPVGVVLASRSPQRREILERLGIQFTAEPPEVEELRGGDPESEVPRNARRKAEAVARPGFLAVGCDTEVVLDGRALGKPADAAQARRYLEALSGRRHEVISAVAVAGPEPGRLREGACASGVAFRALASEEIDRYVGFGEWRGRAGGYAVQGLGSTLVEAVHGDVSNVIGLPVGLLAELAPELFGRS
ncbi:MAG: Maf family protein [Solirubrobacterales bacterium]